MSAKKLFLSLLVFLINPLLIYANEAQFQAKLSPAKYGLSNISENRYLGLKQMKVETGSNIYKIHEFYERFYKAEDNENINEVSKDQILTMIVELNSVGKDPAIVFHNSIPVLVTGKNIILTEPSTLVNTQPITNIVNKLNEGKLNLTGLSKYGDTPLELSKNLQYNYASSNDRLNNFKSFNPGIFKDNDNRKMASNQEVLFIEGPSKYIKSNLGLNFIKDDWQPIILAYNKTGEELEYSAEFKSRMKLVCIDLSILVRKQCVGEKCLDENVVDVIEKIIKKEGGLAAYTIFDRELFSVASKNVVDEQKRWCKGAIYSTDNSQRIMLDECDDKIGNGYACSGNKVLLEYEGNKDIQANITFLLLQNSRNNFIDAINVNFKINYDIDGTTITSLGKVGYNKFAQIAFPKQINKHTLVVLKDDPYLRFALMTKTSNKKLLFSSWKEESQNITDILKRDLTDSFQNIENLKI
jgi:hypothetical protein